MSTTPFYTLVIVSSILFTSFQSIAQQLYIHDRLGPGQVIKTSESLGPLEVVHKLHDWKSFSYDDQEGLFYWLDIDGYLGTTDPITMRSDFLESNVVFSVADWDFEDRTIIASDLNNVYRIKIDSDDRKLLISGARGVVDMNENLVYAISNTSSGGGTMASNLVVLDYEGKTISTHDRIDLPPINQGIVVDSHLYYLTYGSGLELFRVKLFDWENKTKLAEHVWSITKGYDGQIFLLAQYENGSEVMLTKEDNSMDTLGSYLAPGKAIYFSKNERLFFRSGNIEDTYLHEHDFQTNMFYPLLNNPLETVFDMHTHEEDRDLWMLERTDYVNRDRFVYKINILDTESGELQSNFIQIPDSFQILQTWLDKENRRLALHLNSKSDTILFVDRNGQLLREKLPLPYKAQAIDIDFEKGMYCIKPFLSGQDQIRCFDFSNNLLWDYEYYNSRIHGLFISRDGDGRDLYISSSHNRVDLINVEGLVQMWELNSRSWIQRAKVGLEVEGLFVQTEEGDILRAKPGQEDFELYFHHDSTRCGCLGRFAVGSSKIANIHKDKLEPNKVMIYPNPTSDWLVLEGKGINHMQVYFADGVQFFTRPMDKDKDTHTISTSDWPSGPLSIVLKTEYGLISEQILIRR